MGRVAVIKKTDYSGRSASPLISPEKEPSAFWHALHDRLQPVQSSASAKSSPARPINKEYIVRRESRGGASGKALGRISKILRMVSGCVCLDGNIYVCLLRREGFLN